MSWRAVFGRPRLVIAALVFVHTLFFFAFVPRPPRVLADNYRYEVSAHHLAEGRGIALPWEAVPDPTVRGWACSRHPDSCENGLYPVAIYPPGYIVYIAAVYRVVGRSLWAVLVSQLALLWVLVVLAERLARKLLDEIGYAFFVSVLAVYPFFARQAAAIMSDHLHVVLLLSALGAILLLPAGLLRGLAFGASLGAATITRPYSVLTLPLLLVWRPMWKERGAKSSEWACAAVAAVLPIVVWTTRNFVVFGRFIPFSTMGLGATLDSLRMEVEIGNVYDPANATAYFAQLARYGDMSLYTANAALQADAMAWIRAHPWATFGVVAWHVPKLWVSLGEQGRGLGVGSIAVGAGMFVLWLLGMVGLWQRRKDRTWHVLGLAILSYWLFLLPSAEARRTLPLRVPMLLYAASAVAGFAARRRRHEPAGPASRPG